MRNINFLGNQLDHAKLFELYLKQSKFLKTFNNKPLFKKPINPNELQNPLKRKRSDSISEEDEKEITKPIKASNNKEETTPKKIVKKIKEKPIINTPKEEIPLKKIEKEVIQKIITKKKKVGPSQNKEKITNILSKREVTISKWD